MNTREIVIWAHSECRSTMALFREVKRLSGVPVTIALWKHGNDDDVRMSRETCGQPAGQYADLGLVPVGEDFEKGMSLLAKHRGPGSVHVFCVYQNSPVWRKLVLNAKDLGSRVVVYAEAPCEMCTGVKALAKRLYYRFILPFKVRKVAKAADLFLNQSGVKGVGRLLRLGWAKEKIVPFGYASEVGMIFTQRRITAPCGWTRPVVKRPSRAERVPRGAEPGSCLHVLHTGVESKYRDVGTLRCAADLLRKRGIDVEVKYTGGKVDAANLPGLYAWADVFVACGLCEPWGMRVNDAIHAGLPVIVSDGMGAKWLVEQFGCGCVYRHRDVHELADVLERMAKDADFTARIKSGVKAAHEAWKPEKRAKDFLEIIER